MHTDDVPTGPVGIPVTFRDRPALAVPDGDTARQLLRQRIVWDIAQELAARPMDELAHDDGSPRSGFVTAVCAEYVRRGGERRADNEAVALVVLTILSLSPDELIQLWSLPDDWQPKPASARPC